ncbi:MAG: peptidoglycan DD-metalloendopeptidase family protein [Paludibacteraceae bacterium]
MNKKITYLITIISLILSCNFGVRAQSMETLKKQRMEIQERINETNKLLKETQKNEKASLKKLNALKKNLNERRNLIKNYNDEINVLDRKMNSLTAERIELEKQLEKLKGDYARLIRKTQANMNSYSRLMFLLSAKDFDQTIRRVRYLREFTDYKKEQVKQIEQVKTQIALKTDSLDQNKLAKMGALKAKQLEAEKLKKDESEEKSMYASLQQEEKRLSEEYRAHQRKKDQIDNKIQQVIEEEIRRAEARRRAEEARIRAEQEARRKIEERKMAEARAAEQRKKAESQNKKTETIAESKPAETTKPVETTSKTEIATTTGSGNAESVSAYTREERLLSGNFANNQGRLPWPVDRGYIRGHYGTQPHPELKYVTINNKGVYFRSPAGTNARAVFEGVVTRIFSLPGTGNAVIVQHGNYRTLYANLSEVFVRSGEHVSARQPIGKIYTDDESGQAELQFNLYNGSQMVNPESWLTR